MTARGLQIAKPLVGCRMCRDPFCSLAMMTTARILAIALCALVVACATPEVVRDPSSPAARGLVDLRTLKQEWKYDIRYATRSNFTGEQLYPYAGAWLQRDAAIALRRVQRDLHREGLGLKIYDGYRPLHVQQKMWDLIRDERYVSNPAKNAGRHTRGTAVDVTLVDARGRELPMPTPFDDFTEKAHRDAQNIPPAARRNSERLARVMARHGFIPYPYEWWHFDFAGWEKYPPLDVPLTSLATSRSKARHLHLDCFPSPSRANSSR